MKKQKPQPTDSQSTPKRPYAPPNATFVPLKPEERLLACAKFGSGPCKGGAGHKS